ncbi:MAG: tRNA pseudouridine(38-40) synthase TruA [Bacteroidales bacterium]|nr:tRNA pseudouridine(38-40) synthase TruA [Bacteroidales bacterium]
MHNNKDYIYRNINLKTRYFIYLRYKGTSYFGWQVQPGHTSIQERTDKALSLALGESISCTGAGRTDTGVHASFYCAHFDCEKDNLDNDTELVFRLNRILPEDISVNVILKVRPDAHARFGALSRTYRYCLSRGKNPFATETSWYVYGDLNVEAMNEAGRILMLHSDFTSFSKLHSGNKTNTCRVLQASWENEGEMLVFTIRADRFLRNMVRAIVGTMINVGFGKLTPREFGNIIAARDRKKAGQSAPARGLFLAAIEYPEELFIP